MVVYVLIYIEGCEDIECLTEINLPRNNHTRFEDREEVCCTDYRVRVDNGHDPITPAIKVRLDDPHTVVGIGVVEGLAEVMEKGT